MKTNVFEMFNNIKFKDSLVFLTISMMTFPILAIDLDQDGMSDVWQETYGVPSHAGEQDPNGNGIVNRIEARFGLNPNPGHDGMIALSGKGATGISPEGQEFVGISFPTIKGVFYQVEWSITSPKPDAQWYPLGPVQIGDGGAEPRTVLNGSVPLQPGSPQFYRITGLEPVDADNDGLDSYEEGLLLTEDSHIDDDGDLVPTVIEFVLGFDPNDLNQPSDPLASIRPQTQDVPFTLFTESKAP